MYRRFEKGGASTKKSLETVTLKQHINNMKNNNNTNNSYSNSNDVLKLPHHINYSKPLLTVLHPVSCSAKRSASFTALSFPLSGTSSITVSRSQPHLISLCLLISLSCMFFYLITLHDGEMVFIDEL